ncbi:MAG: hypothetical protein JSW07_07480 [bacterium]|nr:MAG: hypothetical protein JSW07_07480 [bacterium]
MEGNKITAAILVSTYAIIITAICLTSFSPFPTDELKPPHSVSKCRSPPTKVVTKSFFWTVPADWEDPNAVYPLCDQPIDVYYWNCTQDWVLIYDDKMTSTNGEISMNLIPGRYKFVYYAPGYDPVVAPCCKWVDYHYVDCRTTELPDNFIDKVKGGDKAPLFFPGIERLPSLSFLLTSAHLNQSSLGEMGVSDRN